MHTKIEEEQLIDGGKNMSVVGHLTELRYRIIVCLVGVLACFFGALCFSSQIILFLQEPLLAVLKTDKSALHFTGPLDVFLTSIKVSLLVAVVFASPLWLFQFWKFIEPALYSKERKSVLPFMVSSISLFIVGIGFSYYGILPIALEFLIALGQEVGTPIITITDYTSLLMLMLFGFGFVFETPLILILLAKLELITADMLRNYRRYVCVGVLIVGAILTPPDPMSQVGMAIPLYLMYEVSIMIIGMMERKKKRQQQTP